MSLEDYVQKKKSTPPSWMELLYNVDDKNIEDDKIELIKEFAKYIKGYHMNYELYHLIYPYNDVIIQIKAKDDRRMAAKVKPYKESYDYQLEETKKIELTEEEYKQNFLTATENTKGKAMSEIEYVDKESMLRELEKLMQ